jgi:hypothetical protein
MQIKKGFSNEKPFKIECLVSTYFNVNTMRLLTLILR